jgi:hypothetical protein
MDDSHVGGPVPPPPVLTANFGAASSTDFASSCARSQQQIINLTLSVNTTQQERDQDPEPSADDLAKQISENEQYNQQYTSLSNSLASLASSPGITDPDKAMLSNVMADLNTLGSTVVALMTGTSMAVATYNFSDTAQSQQSDDKDASSPQLPSNEQNTTGSGTGSADIKSSDTPNLFLATSLMAVMFKTELGLVQQMIQNKDAERKVKIEGFENFQSFAKASAESTYNKDMDQANMYLNDAVCSFVSAGLTLGMAAFSFAYSAKMVGESLGHKELLNDNTGYEKALGLHKTSTRKQEYLPMDLKDEAGNPVGPGVKQIESEIQRAQNEAKNLKNTASDASRDFSVTADREARIKELEEKIIPALQEKLATQSQKYHDANPNHMYNQQMQAKQQMLNSINQAIGSIVQGVQKSIDAGIQMKLANDDAAATIAQAAMQMAQQYLQSAMEAFSGESKNIETVLQFLMSASSKNTQWSSIRA